MSKPERALAIPRTSVFRFGSSTNLLIFSQFAAISRRGASKRDTGSARADRRDR